MNQKIKLLIGAVCLIAVIGLSTGVYQYLSANYMPPQNDALLPQGSGNPATPTDGEAPPAAPEKTRAPDFSVVDGAGKTVKLSDFKGKPVVVNFWASWCPPCKAEMPDFQTVWNEVGDDVVFMMINATDGARETTEKAQKYITEQGFTFPVYYDTTQEASYTYGVSSLPTTLMIDRDGYLVTGQIGTMSEAALREGIALITAPSADSTAVPSESAVYTKITPAEAKSKMDAGEGFVLLDVRSAAEYAEKRIDGAVLIPDSELESRAAAELPDKNAAIYVYCRSGRRSEVSAKKLVELGYTAVYDFGGINDWTYDTVSG